jgi:mono/diheme cytochrome c family protein
MFDFLLRLLSALAFLGAAAVSLDASAQNVERGRELYENHCRVCHTEQVHGRRNRAALSVGDLREIVDQWQSNQGLRWTREEIDDVVLYLANTRYFFLTRQNRERQVNK